MVTRKTRAAAAESVEPPKLKMSVEDAKRRLHERIDEGKKIAAESINSSSGLEESERAFLLWNSYNTEMLRRMFTTGEVSEKYAAYSGPGVMFITMGQGRNLGQEIRDHFDQVRSKTDRLTAIETQLELYEVVVEIGNGTPVQAVEATSAPAAHDNRVFIVHGHDHGKRDAVALLLKTLDLDPITLSEQPNGGRTIIEKFEHNADVGFAIVLITADDVGGVDVGQLKPRARQNVILELGYFVGRLKRARVCALYESGVELPSDIIGVGYVPLDDAGRWKYDLAKELRAAGYSVDMNRL